MTRLAIVLGLVCARIALADPTPQEASHLRFEQGQKFYNLGKFPEAVAEFEAAYQLDPDPVYLFNLAQTHRLAGNRDRAVFFYRRYLDLLPDAPNRGEVTERIATLEAEIRAKPEPEKPAAPSRRWFRLGIDVGWSIIYLVGLHDNVPPQLTERLLIAYIAHVGAWSIDLGGSFQLTTIPYSGADLKAYSANFTEFTAVAAASHSLWGRLSGRLSIGLGTAGVGNLRDGNPLTTNMEQRSDQRMWCARTDATLAYTLSDQTPRLDLVFTVVSGSVASRTVDLRPELSSFATLEGLYLGLYAGF